VNWNRESTEGIYNKYWPKNINLQSSLLAYTSGWIVPKVRWDVLMKYF
jgi:hypothetical protein